MYKVWSTYPPALWHSPSGLKLAAGTIHKVQKGTVTLANDCSFPEGTVLSHFTWMRPSIAAPAGPLTAEYAYGSKGDIYIVETWRDGKATCSCPGYSFRKSCKHIGAIK